MYMKFIKSLSIFAISAIALTACNRFSKEQRVAEKLEGKWSVKNIVLPIKGKDSALVGNGNWIDLRFDDCPNVNQANCNMALTIKVSENVAQDKYIPVGYIVEGKEELKLLWNNDTLYFKIDEYKKDALKLSGTDSAFSAPNNYIIEAERL